MTQVHAPHVAVVGAGFVGVAIADALVRRGCAVTIVARTRELAGASAVTYAWLNSHRKRPAIYQELNERGLRHWREVFGPAHPEHVHWRGHTVVLEESANVEALTTRIEYLASLGYPTERTTAEDVAAELPIHVPDGAITATFPSEGHCEPGPIRAALLERVERSGLCSWELGEAVAVEDHAITLRSGRRVQADHIVVAAGNGSSGLLRTAGFDLPMVGQDAGGPAWGFLAEARVTGHGIPCPVTTDHVNIRPFGSDLLLVQALELDDAAGPDVVIDPSLYERFRSRVVDLVGRSDVEIIAVRVGHRVIPADGMSVVGPVDGDPRSGLWTVVTHSGITLAPFLASTVAAEIVEGTQYAVLDDFRPRRFAREEPPVGGVATPRRPGEQ
ncbi:MAG: FAD-binding oxidoreductase [Kocuria sp.]|nr:FAD-binding oxidoreductase [Kocuria sp.]